MRIDSTKPEQILWQAVRNRQLDGLKFRRQVPILGYIADFVCFEARLVVEIDGAQHSESQLDATRDAAFEAAGYRVVRFWNDAVLQDIGAVCAHVMFEAKARRRA